MSQIYSYGLPPQGIQIYKLLLNNRPLNATEIGLKLKIKPQAVYRVVDHLSNLGLVKELFGRPKTFEAINRSQARDLYANSQKTYFDSLVPNLLENSKLKNSLHIEESLFSVAFIEGRNEIFEKITEDINRATDECKFIVLGLAVGISQDLLLAQKEAVDRGIPIKIIVQEFSKKNEVVLRSWIRAGMKLRLGNAINFHLLLIDNTISYLMTFNPDNKIKRSAVRIVHKSINMEFQGLFNYHWKESKSIQF